MQTFLEPGTSGYPGFEFSGYRASNRPPIRGRIQQPLYNKNRNHAHQATVEKMFKNARTSGTGKLGSFSNRPTRASQHYETLRKFNAEAKKQALNQGIQPKLKMVKLMNSIAKIPEWNNLPTNTKRIILEKINKRLVNAV